MQLKQIDNYLSSISLKEKFYIYLMVVIGSLFLSFYFLFEPSDKRYSEALRKEQDMKLKISEYKSYLMFHDEHETILFKRTIKESEKDLENFKGSIDYLNYQLQDLSDIVYNKRAWSHFLHSITTVAKESGVAISTLKNLPQKSLKMFDEVLQIEITFRASYIDTVLFIDRLESSDLIVDVKSIDTLRENGVQIVKIPDRRYRFGYRTERVHRNSEKLTTTIKLSIWGIQ